MKVDIVTVGDDKSLLKQYIDFPHQLYKDDPHYVPELYMAQKDMFSRKKNPFFEHSEVSSFLAKKDGKIVGRVTAIINNNYNKYHNCKVGFFGFFDVIDNYKVCEALLDRAKEWCQAKGLNAIIGPTNFTINDTAGLLIEGFDEPAKIMMTYNKPYYQGLLEKYGYKKEMDFLAYILYTKKASEKSIRLAIALEERLKRQGIVFRNITKKSLSQDVVHVRSIFNDAWSENWGFVPMTDRETAHLANELKMILNPDWCYIAEDKGVPVGFSLTVNNINEITINFKKGRLLPFNILKLLRNKSKTDYVRIMALGVKDAYRKKGIEAIFFSKNILQARKDKVIAGEVSWVLEDNLEMNASAIKLNSELYKRYRIFKLDI